MIHLKNLLGKKPLLCALIGLVTGMANGLFGSGGGTLAVPAMILLLGEEERRAHATAIAIILPLTLLSAFLYISNAYINWDMTLEVTLGGVCGGFLGARLLHICPKRILRKVFAAFIILAAIRMLM